MGRDTKILEVAKAGCGLSLDPDRRPTETTCWLLVVPLRRIQPGGGRWYRHRAYHSTETAPHNTESAKISGMVEGLRWPGRPGSVGSRPVLKKRRQRGLEVFGKPREALGEVLTMHDAIWLRLVQGARVATYKRTTLMTAENLLRIRMSE